jgi:hypothetical protein
MMTPLSVGGVSSDELTLAAGPLIPKSRPYATFGTKDFSPSGTSPDLD